MWLLHSCPKQRTTGLEDFRIMVFYQNERPARVSRRPRWNDQLWKLVMRRVAGGTCALAMHIRQLDRCRAIDIVRNAGNEIVVCVLGFAGGTVLLIDVLISPEGVGAFLHVRRILSDTVVGQ